MKAATKAVYDIQQNLVKTFKKAADVAINAPADFEQVFRDFEKACQDTGNTSVDAARGEVREHVTRHMMDGGMSKAEAEAWFEQKWKDVKDLGDKVRKAAPKVEETAKMGWGKFLGAIAAMLAAGAIFSAINSGPSPEQKAMYRFLQREASETEQMQSFLASEEQFNIMIGGLEVESAPVPVPDAPPPAAAAPSPMPVAVAAEAEKPVEVEVTTPSGTRNFTSTIGRVYQNVPPRARQEIEQEAPKIDHGYDHPTTEFHKDFTVNSPIGSAHFKY